MNYIKHYLSIIICFLILASCAGALPANSKPKTDLPEEILFRKTFNFIYLINNSAALKHKVQRTAKLKDIARQRLEKARKALTTCPDAACISSSFKWNDQEIKAVSQELGRLYLADKHFRETLAQALQQEAYNLKYKADTDTALIRKAWYDTALGMNHILDVYLAGKKPRYPAIDSISFKASDPGFALLLQQELSPALQLSAGHSLFYELPVQAALKALKINHRDESARYEPLEKTYNESPLLVFKQTEWNKYAYSLILVLGHGPEDPAIALDAGAAHYCDLAAQMYRAGAAPFIVVSGGNVHPYKTPYNEAEEMRKYLVDQLGIPAAAVLMEPHARHTTTNLRNVSRLVYRFKLPDHKPILTLTNPNHSRYTLNISTRCLQELGYLPFRDMKKVSEEANAFYPVAEALRVNPYEPLDP